MLEVLSYLWQKWRSLREKQCYFVQSLRNKRCVRILQVGDDWLINSYTVPASNTAAMPESAGWPNHQSALDSSNTPYFTYASAWPVIPFLRVVWLLSTHTYISVDRSALWHWYMALTQRQTVLLCPRSLDTWWATATMKPCRNSAGHSNRDPPDHPTTFTLVQIASSMPLFPTQRSWILWNLCGCVCPTGPSVSAACSVNC